MPCAKTTIKVFYALSKYTDADGLYDCVETNTGEYLNASNTGTDPLNADTDGDEFTDDFQINTNHTINISSASPNP